MTDEPLTISELGAYTNNSPNKEGLKKLVKKVNEGGGSTEKSWVLLEPAEWSTMFEAVEGASGIYPSYKAKENLKIFINGHDGFDEPYKGYAYINKGDIFVTYYIGDLYKVDTNGRLLISKYSNYKSSSSNFLSIYELIVGGLIEPYADTTKGKTVRVVKSSVGLSDSNNNYSVGVSIINTDFTKGTSENYADIYANTSHKKVFLFKEAEI